MITYWLLIVVLNLVLGLVSPLSLLPDAVLDPSVAAGISNIAGFVGLVWKFFPITLSALVASIVIIVIAENWVLTYKIIRWVYHKIPGVS